MRFTISARQSGSCISHVVLQVGRSDMTSMPPAARSSDSEPSSEGFGWPT